VELILPETVDLSGGLAPIEAVVRITNIFSRPVALQCDGSERATTYLRFESISSNAVRSQRTVTARELVYDLGDQLAEVTGERGIRVLAPGEVVESRVDIAPIVYPDFLNSDQYGVCVELRSVPWDGTGPMPETTRLHEPWFDRAIVSEQRIITVTGFGTH
jgi:hypothetical protein